MATKKFEDKMLRLKEIVELLEKGEVTLDDSLKLYEEGVKLGKELKKTLNDFETKIAEIDGGSQDA